MKYGFNSLSEEFKMSDVMSDCSDDSFEVVSAETCEEPEDVLTSTYKPLVLFQEMFDVYPVDSDIVTRVSFAEDYVRSPEDTVIIMPLAWTSIDQGLYVAKLSGKFVQFDVKDLPKTSADKFYQLCYASKGKTIVGVSAPFSFREVHEDELIEFQKEQNKEFWTFRSRFAVLMNIYWNSLVENGAINIESVDCGSEQSDDSLVDLSKCVDDEAVTGSKLSENEILEIAAIIKDDATDSVQQPEIPKQDTEKCDAAVDSTLTLTTVKVEPVLGIDLESDSNCTQQGGNPFLVTPPQVDTPLAIDSNCVQQGGNPFLVTSPQLEGLPASDSQNASNDDVQIEDEGLEVKDKLDQLTQACWQILKTEKDERLVFEECLTILGDVKEEKISQLEANKNIIEKLKSFNDDKFEELLNRKQADLYKMNTDVNHIKCIQQQEINNMRKRIMELEKLVFELMPDGWSNGQAVVCAPLQVPKTPLTFEAFVGMTYGPGKPSPLDNRKFRLAFEWLQSRFQSGSLARTDVQELLKALDIIDEGEKGPLAAFQNNVTDPSTTPPATNDLQEKSEVLLPNHYPMYVLDTIDVPEEDRYFPGTNFIRPKELQIRKLITPLEKRDFANKTVQKLEALVTESRQPEKLTDPSTTPPTTNDLQEESEGLLSNHYPMYVMDTIDVPEEDRYFPGTKLRRPEQFQIRKLITPLEKRDFRKKMVQKLEALVTESSQQKHPAFVTESSQQKLPAFVTESSQLKHPSFVTESRQPEKLTEAMCQVSLQSKCDDDSKDAVPKMVLKSSSLSPAVQQMETPFLLSLQDGVTKLRCEIDLLQKETENSQKVTANLHKKLCDTHSDLDYFKNLYQAQLEEKNQKEVAYGAKLAKLVFEKERVLGEMKQTNAQYEERLKKGAKEYAKIYLKYQKYKKNCKPSDHTYAANGPAAP